MFDNEMRAWLQVVDNVRPCLPADLRVEALLDAGGQGVVYRGMVDSVDAAVKIYLPGQVDKRVEREIKALKEIQCPTIVDLLWSDRVTFEDYELNVVATSFVQGTPLNQARRQGPIGETQLCVIAYDVARAIQAMWEKKIVHRDLKPSNIMLRPNGRVCVIDLGIARHLTDSSLTETNMTWGTMGYYSPEQRRGVRQLTYRSDIFALGIVLLEAALGRHPTSGDQLRLEARRYHEALPEELSDWAIARLVKQMLNPSPVKRPRPREIMDALSAYSE